MMIYAFTEAAEGHTNEDAIAHQLHPANGDFALCGLADGQGGRSGGAAAARLAVSSMIEATCEAKPETLLKPLTWVDVYGVVDREVAVAPDAGYCTLVVLVATGEWVVGTSSGDSAAVLILEQTTVVLTDRQRKNPPVGSGAAVFEPFSMELPEWWRILVVSDGVWKYVGWERMVEIGRSEHGSDVAKALRQEVAARSGGLLPDDFSVIGIDP